MGKLYFRCTYKEKIVFPSPIFKGKKNNFAASLVSIRICVSIEKWQILKENIYQPKRLILSEF